MPRKPKVEEATLVSESELVLLLRTLRNEIRSMEGIMGQNPRPYLALEIKRARDFHNALEKMARKTADLYWLERKLESGM